MSTARSCSSVKVKVASTGGGGGEGDYSKDVECVGETGEVRAGGEGQ
jgi:hypothetical protein